CYNALDRHIAARGDQKALVWISTEVGETRTFTYKQLLAEVNRAAAMLQSLGVKKGERVILYLPMIPEACFAILACARLGAVHSVVFGGFAAASLAARIDDAKPALMITAVGGYAVALAASMKNIFCGEAGETMFTTSDIGWVVGHSYIIYAPLIAGMTTIMYEGVPIRPDAGIWWKIVQDHQVDVMFSAPTAIRVLKKQDPAYLKKYDVSSLRHLFLAGEPLDEPTHVWITESLGRPVIDHY